MGYNNTIQTIFISQPINAVSFLLACHIICFVSVWAIWDWEWYLFYFHIIPGSVHCPLLNKHLELPVACGKKMFSFKLCAKLDEFGEKKNCLVNNVLQRAGLFVK